MAYVSENYGYGYGGSGYGGGSYGSGGSSSYGSGGSSSSYGSGASSRGGGSDRAGDSQEDPPHSRLFVIGGKHCEEHEIKAAFSKYGEVEYVSVKKDRDSGRPKGMSYIKFTKTSAAAEAMEELNGQCLGSDPRPIKVVIAGSRSATSNGGPGQDINPTRLFIMVPKTANAEELKSTFGAYGDVEHVSLVHDKATGNPKGLAFVNYHRFKHAARAIEECDTSFKAKFATPKEDRAKPRSADPVGGGGGGDAGSLAWGQGMANASGCCRLKVLFNPSVSKDMFWALFNIVPGLVTCDLVDMTKVCYLGIFAFFVC